MIKQQDITTLDLQALPIIWDVRDKNAYSAGHVAGAVNIPLSSISTASLLTIPAHLPIYVLCGGGTRAGRAVALLESLDATRIYIELQGGTRAAKAAHMRIEMD